MNLTRRNLALLIAIFALLAVTALWAGKKKDKKSGAAQMDDRQQALHALNRLTFGPRPGDVDKVMSMGVQKWIDLQLHPEKIDDSPLQARLAPLRTINMSTAQIVLNFPPEPLIKAVENGKMALPHDPGKRAVYMAQIQKDEQKKQAKAEQSDADENSNSMSDEQKAARQEARMFAEIKLEELLAMTPENRNSAIAKMKPEDRIQLVRNLKPADKQRLYMALPPEQREQWMALQNPTEVVVTELQQAKVLRAIYSDRQLEEVMTDFWFNHFNVYLNKGPDRYLTTAYERDVIRAHALGKFKDLLVATAKSPAMLWYLDNWDSVGPNSEFAHNGGRRVPPPRMVRRGFGGPFGRPPIVVAGAPRRAPNAKPKAPKGLNENYARELMELQTLGVDGGYTQHDVTEVAKVFTGWTIKEPRRGGGYEFDEQRHEPGPKFVLGKNIKQNGEKEGMQVLEMLARKPATAHFVSKKLAIRFVSDNPPPSLVDRMTTTFLKSDGDIREVLRTMFDSPEFWAPEAYRDKVKTPFEFVVSAVRATGANVDNPLPLVQVLNRMGEPLYQQQPPTGYPMTADAWVNSAALLARMNFSLALGTGRFPGVSFDAQQAMGPAVANSPESLVGSFENTLLAGNVSPQTHETILKQMSDPQVTGRKLDDPSRPINAGVVAGLILGSPEFQRR